MSERYGVFDDPYLYPGIDVLINKLGVRDAERLDPPAFLAAMIASFKGDETPLAAQFRALIF